MTTTEQLDLTPPDQLPAVRRAEGNGVPAVGAVSLLPVPEMQAVLAQYDERRRAFRAWLLSQLQEGVHYGVVPGTEYRGNPIDPRQWRTNKPSLYKAGADFLCDLLMLDPAFSPCLDTWRMLGSKEGTVAIHCRLLSRGDSPFFPGRAKGEVIGEGRGVGIAGVKKRDGNGAVKIAQKSSKVDAVINTLGISDLFTQDRDDAPPPRDQPPADPDAPRVATRAERAAQADDGIPRVTVDDLNELAGEWRRITKRPNGTAAEFAAWAKGVLKTDADLTRVGSWSVDSLDAVRGAI